MRRIRVSEHIKQRGAETGKESEEKSERSYAALRVVSTRSQPSLPLSEHKCVLFINLSFLSSCLV